MTTAGSIQTYRATVVFTDYSFAAAFEALQRDGYDIVALAHVEAEL